MANRFPRSSAATRALAPFALLAAACGDATPPTVLDLLVRAPDLVFDEPGPLVPDQELQWGPHGGPGWSKTVALRADDTPYLETNQPRATLRLPAARVQERTLAITLWCAEPGAPRPTVNLSLNGIVLDALVLQDEPETVRLATDAALWRQGENLLAFELPIRADGGWDTVAVAEVVYGPERRIVRGRAADGVRLPAGTGLRYMIEAQDEAHLSLAASSSGTGVLTLRIATMDPRTGDIDRTSGFDLALPYPDRFPVELDLPPSDGAVRVAELAWESPEGASLAIEALAVREPGPDRRPTIVFISVDTYAARHMSLYGYERQTTPRLDQLAADAVVFERCVANAPWTMPSYLSVMTGLYPRAHRTRLAHRAGLELAEWDRWQVADNRWTLAEALRARGYQTAASVDTEWLAPRFRIHQGFDLYDMEPARYPFDQPDKGIVLILERFTAWLDSGREPSAPAFVFLQVLDAHGPYWPESPFLGTFAGDLPADLRPTPAGSAHRTYRAIPLWMARTLVPDRAREIPPELPLETIIARYDESILKVDAYIGRLCDALRERGLYDDAVIVVTADHGESFDHETYSHGNLWEDIVHVPLLIKLPRGEHGGSRVAQSVQLVDLYPTLSALAGIDAARAYLHGRSLLPLIGGADVEGRPTYSEGGHIEQHMIELDGWKLVELQPGKAGGVELMTHPLVPEDWMAVNFPELGDDILTEELWGRIRERADFAARFAALQELVMGPYYRLYDLSADPDELRDVADAHPETVARLRELLAQAKARAGAARDDARGEVVLAPPSEEVLQRLRELGYGGEEDKKKKKKQENKQEEDGGKDD